MANVLRKTGLKVGHERVDADGTVSYYFAPRHADWLPRTGDDSDYGNRHRLQRPQHYDFKYVFHQVRHPLKVIASVQWIIPTADWQYIAEHVASIDPKPKRRMLRAMRYWLEWNLLVEQRFPTMRFRLEDPPWGDIGFLLGVGGMELVAKDVRRMNRSTGWRKAPKLQWHQLEAVDPKLTDAIRRKALEYGYEVTDGEEETSN